MSQAENTFMKCLIMRRQLGGYYYILQTRLITRRIVLGQGEEIEGNLIDNNQIEGGCAIINMLLSTPYSGLRLNHTLRSRPYNLTTIICHMI